MKFFINYFRASRFSGTKINSVSQLGFVRVLELFELIFVAMFLAFIFSMESDLSFYYLDIALYASACHALRVSALTSGWCKYRVSAMMPSSYKMRAAGEYFNGLMFFFMMLAIMCAIFCLSTLLSLMIGAEQMFIDTNQNGVEAAFKISLLLWLAANGAISGRISSFGKRVIYDLIYVIVTVGACLLIKSASEGFTRFIIAGNVAAMFSALPNAALWLVPCYTASLAVLTASVFITLNHEKPKDF